MSTPLDMVRSLLDEPVIVKLRNSRELRGTLHAYDEHCNMVLGDAEETVYHMEESGNVSQTKNNSAMLFVRGDSVVLIRQ